MTKLFEETVAKVRKLSAEEQSMLAEILLYSNGDAEYRASPEELEAIERGRTAIREGRIATAEEVEAVFAKYRRA